MGEVVELKIKRDLKYGQKCPTCGGHSPNYETIWKIVEHVTRFKSMTLWDRIFNWPY